MKLSQIILLVLILLTVACSRVRKKNFVISPGWHKLSLANGWVIYAPPGFTAEAAQGVDSEPGVVYSKNDSIYLQYDSGRSERNNQNCGFDDLLQEAKASIDTGFYKTFYKVPVVHKAYIDTIDNKVAIICEPVAVGKGTIGIEILGCRNSPWLGLTAENLSAEKEKLVLKIYRTIRQIRP